MGSFDVESMHHIDDGYHPIDPGAVAELAVSLHASVEKLSQLMVFLDTRIGWLSRAWTGQAENSFHARYSEFVDAAWLQLSDLKRKAEALMEFAEAVETRERRYAAAWS